MSPKWEHRTGVDLVVCELPLSPPRPLPLSILREHCPHLFPGLLLHRASEAPCVRRLCKAGTEKGLEVHGWIYWRKPLCRLKRREAGLSRQSLETGTRV